MPRDPDAEGPKFQPTGSSLIFDAAFCATVIGGFFAWRRYLRQFSSAMQIPDSQLRGRTIFGKVLSVGDADNFRLYHTPGGYLAGWGWLRRIPRVNSRGIGSSTIHVRLCGVDAPECSHFGKPAQPYSKEALEWLRNYILGRRVRIVPLAKDQYERVVAEVRVWKLTGLKNVSREMLRNGWAVVYEGKTGAEFNGLKDGFQLLEDLARWRKIGIFQKGTNITTPAQYKRKYS